MSKKRNGAMPPAAVVDRAAGAGATDVEAGVMATAAMAAAGAIAAVATGAIRTPSMSFSKRAAPPLQRVF